MRILCHLRREAASYDFTTLLVQGLGDPSTEKSLLSEAALAWMSRKCLRRADFADASMATQEIETFILTYNTHLAHPFGWKKGVRFYKRLKDKIAARSELQLAA